MAYSVEKLNSVSDCDSLTKLLAKEKDDLDFRLIVLNRQIRSYTANAADLTADLVAVEPKSPPLPHS